MGLWRHKRKLGGRPNFDAWSPFQQHSAFYRALIARALHGLDPCVDIGRNARCRRAYEASWVIPHAVNGRRDR